MKKVYRENSIVESDIGDDLLLFNSSQQRFHALNLTGKIIWQNFFSEDDFDNCVDAVKTAYGLSPKENIDDDVNKFIDLLEKSGLLKAEPASRTDPSEMRTLVTTSRMGGKEYVAPLHQEIPIKWLKERHPAAFLGAGFGDTWGPATDALV